MAEPGGERRPFAAAGRALNLQDLADRRLDILVIGGGITGAGIALEATRRGYDVGLVEARDFASGTSSRSSKLVHGGFRYLGQGEVGLVHEALQERRRLCQMFPDLVHPLPFLMPIPKRLATAAMLAAGLWTYDTLSIGSGFPRHQRVSLDRAREEAPALSSAPIRGAWKFWDAQTDDARLTVEVLRRAAGAGALVANYAPVRSAERRDGWWRVEVEDVHTGGHISVRCRYLVNAGGVWAESVGGLAGHADTRVRPSKGVHLSLAASSLPISCALIFPVGAGRVMFAIPWHGYVIVGTTDDDYAGDIASPGCSEAEAESVLRGLNRFFDLRLDQSSVLSRWAGVRPLVAQGNGGGKTKDLSRKPHITLGADGLLTVTGGKLTTFWRMALDALALLPAPPPGAAVRVEAPVASAAQPGDPLPGAAGYTTADVARAVEEEMALNLDDALSRRLRMGFLDAAAAWQAAPAAAEVMAQRLGWQSTEAQLSDFADHLAHEFGHQLARATEGRRVGLLP